MSFLFDSIGLLNFIVYSSFVIWLTLNFGYMEWLGTVSLKICDRLELSHCYSYFVIHGTLGECGVINLPSWIFNGTLRDCFVCWILVYSLACFLLDCLAGLGCSLFERFSNCFGWLSCIFLIGPCYDGLAGRSLEDKLFF